MNKLKAALKAFFADYVAHQENSGRGSGSPGVTTDELAELIVEARAEMANPIMDAIEAEVPGKQAKKKKPAAPASTEDQPA